MAPAAERLPRFLTFLLRHKLGEYPLTMDREGFAPWHEVVDLVRQRFCDVTEEQMRALIAGGSKKRFDSRRHGTRYLRPFLYPRSWWRGGGAPSEFYFAVPGDLTQSMLQHGLEPRDRH